MVLSSSGAFLAYWLTACSAWLGCSDVNSWYSEQGDATYLLIRIVTLQLVMEKSFLEFQNLLEKHYFWYLSDRGP